MVTAPSRMRASNHTADGSRDRTKENVPKELEEHHKADFSAYTTTLISIIIALMSRNANGFMIAGCSLKEDAIYFH